MECKYCKIEMMVGEAIKPAIECDALTIMPVAPIKFEELEVIPVYKCPKCGHSEYIE